MVQDHLEEQYKDILKIQLQMEYLMNKYKTGDTVRLDINENKDDLIILKEVGVKN